MGLPQVHIEDLYGSVRSCGKKLPDRAAACLRTLGKGAEANCIRTLGQMFPVERPAQEIPRGRVRNFEPRLSVAIELNLHNTGWMFPFGLHVIDIEAEFFQAPECVDPADRKSVV